MKVFLSYMHLLTAKTSTTGAMKNQASFQRSGGREGVSLHVVFVACIDLLVPEMQIGVCVGRRYTTTRHGWLAGCSACLSIMN